MRNIASKFRIGEKITLGFGLVGCLFLIVVWRYHAMLESTTQDYQRLLDVYVTRLNYAQTIEDHILSARLAEKDFVAHRRLDDAERVRANTDSVLDLTHQLAGLNEGDKPVASNIGALARTYQQAFDTLVKAWRVKGLDYNSGLQGAFRESVHELEALASQFETGDLYVYLLQIRRGEKDLGLRRESQYQVKVEKLIEGFRTAARQSALSSDIKSQLLAMIEGYADAFANYADNVLKGEDIAGGRGPFRDIAHAIEALINQHYVPELKADILQLRRREKDYLLRSEQQYVDMVGLLVADIGDKAGDSGIRAQDKKKFSGLLADYRRDFSALVEQNRNIAQLMMQMEQAVLGITLEVQGNVAQANVKKQAMLTRIDAASAMGERQLFWIVLLATIIGVLFSWVMIRGISRPLRRMVSILDQLSFEETTERMPHVSGGRDEVNVMAGSVNTMAEHRHQFIQWWQTSMAEVEALQDLRTLAEKSGGDLAEVSSSKRQRAEAEVAATALARKDLLNEQLMEVERLNEQSLDNLSSLLSETHLAKTKKVLSQLQHAAQAIKSKLAMIMY